MKIINDELKQSNYNIKKDLEKQKKVSNEDKRKEEELNDMLKTLEQLKNIINLIISENIIKDDKIKLLEKNNIELNNKLKEMENELNLKNKNIKDKEIEKIKTEINKKMKK